IAFTHLWRGDPGGGRARRALATVAGLLVVLAPWSAFSVSHGVIPGEGLMRGYAFYAEGHGAWNVQDDVRDIGDAPAAIPGWGSVIGSNPGAFVWGRLLEIPVHL